MLMLIRVIFSYRSECGGEAQSLSRNSSIDGGSGRAGNLQEGKARGTRNQTEGGPRLDMTQGGRISAGTKDKVSILIFLSNTGQRHKYHKCIRLH